MNKISLYNSSSGVLFFPFFLLLIFFWLIPIFGGIEMSLYADPPPFYYGEETTKKFIGVKHYLNLLKDKTYWKALLNTTSYSLISISLIIPLAFLLAQGILGSIKKFQMILSFLLLIPAITPPSVMATIFLIFFHGEKGFLNFFIITPLFEVLRNTGLEVFSDLPNYVNWQKDPNYIMPSLIIQAVWRWTGFITLFMLIAIRNIPKNLEEVAELEGISWLKRNYLILIPMTKPVIIFSAIFLLIDFFSMFTGAYLLLGGSGGTDNAGLLFVSYVYQTGFTFHEFRKAAAISLSILPPILFLLIVFFWYKRKDIS